MLYLLFLEKDGGLGIATVERVINAAGFIGARRSSPPKLPYIRFLYIGSRVRSTLPSDPASRQSPFVTLVLHFHLVEQGTHTLKQINMPGRHTKKNTQTPARGSAYGNLWLVTEKTSDGDVQTELVHQGQGIRLKSALGLLPLQRLRPLHGS